MSSSDPRLEMLEQATADAFRKLWPLVERAISCTGDDERLAEGLCRLIKYSLRSSRRDQLREKPHRMVAVLPALSAVLRQSFASHRHPSYLFACSECVRAFADHPDAAVKAELQGLLTSMFGDATSRLQRLEDVHNSPDVVDDVFLLALKSMKEDCRDVVLNPPVLPALVDCAVTGMLVMHKEACQSIIDFLVAVVRALPSNTASVGPVLQTRGPHLTCQTLKAMGGALPPARLDDLTPLLLAIIESCREEAVNWVQTALVKIPSTVMADPERASFMHALGQCLSTAPGSEDARAARQLLQGAVDEFSGVCRRSKLTRDAVQQALAVPS